MGRIEDDTDHLAKRLLGSYTIEAEIYQTLLNLAREQGAILEAGDDIDRCAALFSRKDELLRSITRLEAEIEPLKRQWWRENAGLEARERLNGILDCILATIEAIMDQEQRNEQLLLNRHAEVEADLAHVQRGSAMHHTYAGDEPLPRFVDIRH